MPGFRRRFCACVAPVNEPAHQRGAPHRAGARPPAPARTGPGSPLTPARAESRAIAAAARAPVAVNVLARAPRGRLQRRERAGRAGRGGRFRRRHRPRAWRWPAGGAGAKPAPRGPARPARPGAGLCSRGSADATRGARAAPKAAARKFALKPHRGGRKLILGPDSLTEMLKRKGGGAWRPQGRGRAAGRCGPPTGDLTALGRRRLGPAAACLVRLTPRFISGR